MTAVLATACVVGFVGGGVVGSFRTTGKPAPAPSASPAPEPQPVDVASISASCVREPAVDSDSNEVEYDPEFAIDGDHQTGWQCRGDGAGESLEIDLGGPHEVVAVGLIPGYAKVDPHDGTEWYPLNRRLTEVRWHLGETVVEQELDPDPAVRDMQQLELPDPVRTSALRMEIVSSVPGESSAHPNVAITELRVLATS
ncbi:MAG: discoidin domain-containing protein [Actinomycetota bacterium]